MLHEIVVILSLILIIFGIYALFSGYWTKPSDLGVVKIAEDGEIEFGFDFLQDAHPSRPHARSNETDEEGAAIKFVLAHAPVTSSMRVSFDSCGVSIRSGFLTHEDPLRRLPSNFDAWELLASRFSVLLAAGRWREAVDRMPILDATELLEDHRYVRRAALILCMFTHAYVFHGDEVRSKVPDGLGRPLLQVTSKLGTPPVLTHSSIVLYNWARLDPTGGLDTDNLRLLQGFLGGSDESYFFIVTVELEAEGGRALAPLWRTQTCMELLNRNLNDDPTLQDTLFDPSFASTVLAQLPDHPGALPLREALQNADVTPSKKSSPRIQPTVGFLHPSLLYSVASNGFLNKIVDQHLLDGVAPDQTKSSGVSACVSLVAELWMVAYVLDRVTKVMKRMDVGCDPHVFYHRIRPFLAGWKGNPSLPDGLEICGEKFECYGGSAAQSSLLPALDAVLGVEHDSPATSPFLTAMKDYMPAGHRTFLDLLHERGSIRALIRSFDKAPAGTLAHAVVRTHARCIRNLTAFRSSHMAIVKTFILDQQKLAIGSQVSRSEEKQEDDTELVRISSDDKARMKEKGQSLALAAGGKGTGGTGITDFLLPTIDATKKAASKQN